MKKLEELGLREAEAALHQLASVFFGEQQDTFTQANRPVQISSEGAEPEVALETRYKALVDQIPAIIFMANLDRGIGEAYVSPHIEATLGFSQREWMEDPVRWYHQIHPDDKQRWSVETAEMFLSGTPVHSAYRLLTRGGRTIWFQCDVKMMRRRDGRPWFIQGIAVDVTELKKTESALEEERDLLSAILNTVGALVVVLDNQLRIVRFNRACELLSGYSSNEARNQQMWEVFRDTEGSQSGRAVFENMREGTASSEYEAECATRDGRRRRIVWTSTRLASRVGGEQLIVTGTDVTERWRLQQSILEVSGQEQRRIGEDLHDGLGQHLTGIAFMSKVLQGRLAEKGIVECVDAEKILQLVNQAISKTRELARGLRPVFSDDEGLMSALRQHANEVEGLYGIVCEFICPAPVLVSDVNVATHLYHIAQEAVNNAVKHGGARHVIVSLTSWNGCGLLTIEDNGIGFEESSTNENGMGLRIMQHRANMLGGMLHIQGAEGGGVMLKCQFLLRQSELSQ